MPFALHKYDLNCLYGNNSAVSDRSYPNNKFYRTVQIFYEDIQGQSVY